MKQAISGAMADRKRTIKIGVQNSTKKPHESMLSKTIIKGAQNRLQTAFKVKVVGAWHSSERLPIASMGHHRPGLQSDLSLRR
jgi:hypothetical protein